jgi:hypothetical protein
MDDLQTTEESVLCDKCSVIRFIDKAIGGAVPTTRFGEHFLGFKGGVQVGSKMRVYLELEYMHHDRLPDLPFSEASAESGCAFCAALRNAALGLALSDPGRATFELSYVWDHCPPLHKNRLYMLLARTDVRFDAFEPAYTNSLVFHVDCEEGKIMSQQLGTFIDQNRRL